jgi:hypothetical protein
MCRAAIPSPAVNSRVPLSVAIPQTFPTGGVDTTKIRQFLARAEELGFDGAWVVEQIVGGMPILDPVSTLTYAAPLTQRIRSRALSRGRGSRAFQTASCCRSARFSSANSRCVRTAERSVPTRIPSI